MSFLHTLCNRWGIFPRGSRDLAGGGPPPAIELPARFIMAARRYDRTTTARCPTRGARSLNAGIRSNERRRQWPGRLFTIANHLIHSARGSE
jgi:hypothetical protein